MWALQRVFAVPAGGLERAPPCCAAHSSEPLLAVGTADALLVYDTVTGAAAEARGGRSRG